MNATVRALSDRCLCRVPSAGEQYYTAHSESFCSAEQLPPSYSIAFSPALAPGFLCGDLIKFRQFQCKWPQRGAEAPRLGIGVCLLCLLII